MMLFKILVVDDERSIRKLIKNLITLTLGYEVISANNGNEAIEILSKCHFDLVITDYNMSFMNGEELTKFIKKNYPDIKVILVSSYIEGVEKAVVAAGADLVMCKLEFINIENIKFNINKLLKEGAKTQGGR
jgi:CheY-like chemotaxis protein